MGEVIEPSTSHDTGLLERERELARIGRLIVAVAGGEGRVLMVEGPAGIGKTALLDAACAASAQAGFAVLRARGSALEREFAFGVVLQLFEVALDGLSVKQRAALFAGAPGLAAPLLGYTRGGEQRRESGGLAGAPAESFAVVHGLYWLAANMCEQRPLLIALDDAHWSDEASLHVLAHAAQRIEGVPLLLLSAQRPSEGATDDELLDGLPVSADASLMCLDPLSAEAVTALVRARHSEAASDELCTACHTATAGNPFLLRELIGALSGDQIDPGGVSPETVTRMRPDAITRSVLARLRNLPPAATAVARAVAILGDGCELRNVAKLSKVPRAAAVAGADALRAVEILADDAELAFAHPLIAGAVHETIARASRAQMHAEAARLLANAGAASGRVAAHLVNSDPAGAREVVVWLRQAASEALGQGAPEQAARYLTRALSEPPPGRDRVSVLGELAAAEALAGDAGAAEHVRQALALSTKIAERARLTLTLGDILIHSDRAADALGPWDDALCELGECEPELRWRIAVQRAAAAVLDGRLAIDAETELLRLQAHADPAGAASLLSISLAMLCAMRGGAPGEVAELVDRGLEAGRLLGGEHDRTIPVDQLLCALIFSDQLERAAPLIEDLFAIARQRGSVLAYVSAAMWSAHAAARRGDIASCGADARAAMELAEEHSLTLLAPVVRSLLAHTLIEQGAMAEAFRTLEPIPLNQLAHGATAARVFYTRGLTRVPARGQEAMVSDLRHAGEIYEAIRFLNPNTCPWRSTLALALPSAEREEATELIRVELLRAREIGEPRGVGVALHAQGLLAEATAGLELLEQATSMLERSPARLEQARACTDFGAALRRAGHRNDAVTRLRGALDLADRCGAGALAARAREELLAAGARPRRERISGPDALTACERRVAQMAAHGMSNREIAQGLFVTINTVQKHLTHIYQKLEIKRREQLAETLPTGQKIQGASDAKGRAPSQSWHVPHTTAPA